MDADFALPTNRTNDTKFALFVVWVGLRTVAIGDGARSVIPGESLSEQRLRILIVLVCLTTVGAMIAVNEEE